MRTVGIIAEYNPFHAGHKYQIELARQKCGADYVIVVMSPDFVQRGEPAVFDKYTRTHMALSGGADLVLELPVCYACGSAEYFAEGAVSLLDRLGGVDLLCFGAETDNVKWFVQTADILLREPEPYRTRLRQLQKSGKTYPQASAEALNDYCKQSDERPESLGKTDLLSFPNNILGVEYCKALQKCGSAIQPFPVRRTGSDYLSTSLDGPYCSASAIRSRLSVSGSKGSILRHIPSECQALFTSVCRTPVTAGDLLPVLSQKLLSCPDFSNILDITPDLSDRFDRLKYACIGKSWPETVSLLKTRQVTEARIRRALFHLILDITAADVSEYRSSGTVFYAHILGFRKSAAPLLHRLKQSSRISVVAKTARAKVQPGTPAAKMWRTDLFASHLYRSVLAGKYGIPFRTEYEISPVLLPKEISAMC